MKITLSDTEIRAALATALAKKTQYVLGEFDPEQCYFSVITAGSEITDIEEVTFTCEA